MVRRAKALASTSVVGVTCAASSFGSSLAALSPSLNRRLTFRTEI